MPFEKEIGFEIFYEGAQKYAIIFPRNIILHTFSYHFLCFLGLKKGLHTIY